MANRKSCSWHCVYAPPGTFLHSKVTEDGLQALAQDQLRALRQMCAAAFGDDAPHVEVYDGDTVRVI